MGLTVSGLNHVAHMIENKFYDAQLKKMFRIYEQSMREYSLPDEFYASIGGALGDWAANEPQEFQNTCATRLSKALNYGGFEIPNGTPGTYLGADGKSYFIRAEAMSSYLSNDKIWGAPRTLQANQKLRNAVFFQNGFTGGVSGHLDIIYRVIPANHIYKTTTYYWH